MTPLSNRFTRIRILDSTAFQLPAQYASSYKGIGGGGSEAGVKIQLEYELISGEFLETAVSDGTSSDCRYGQERTQTLEPGELSLRDLGYFSIYDLEKIADRKAFYVSRIRWNTQVYQKEKDGKWTLLDLEKLTKDLAEGQILELPEIYIGLRQKHKTRLVIYRLTQTEWAKRLEHHKKAKKRMPKYASRINLLITNVSSKHLPHNEVKPVKLERFQCHLYGQLIGLCLVASITYRMRRLIWEKKQKEVSEYKCTYIVKIYFSSIHDVLFTTFQHPVSVLTRLFQDLVKNGRKA
ncbi:Transposase IS4 family protein [Bacillus mobilis]